MITPIHPCKPGCPGWRIARVLGMLVVMPCRECWSGDILRPTFRYYHRQPECLEALRQNRSYHVKAISKGHIRDPYPSGA